MKLWEKFLQVKCLLILEVDVVLFFEECGGSCGDQCSYGSMMKSGGGGK